MYILSQALIQLWLLYISAHTIHVQTRSEEFPAFFWDSSSLDETERQGMLMLLGVVPKRYRVTILNSVLGLVKLLGQLVRLAR